MITQYDVDVFKKSASTYYDFFFSDNNFKQNISQGCSSEPFLKGT